MEDLRRFRLFVPSRGTTGEVRRPSSGALAITSAVALFGVVAAASHDSVWAPARQGDAPLTTLVATVAAFFLLGSAAVGVVTAVRRRSRGSERPLREELLQAVPITTMAIVLMSILAISRMDLQEYRGPDAEVGSVDLSSRREGTRLEMDWGGSAVRRPGEEETSGQAGADRLDGPPILPWVILAVGLAGLGGLARAWWSRHRGPDDPDRPDASAASHREAARGAVIDTIDGMLADPDPATAIIGAYARLLENLSANGAPRNEYEGPMEHLHRVLMVLDVRAGPLERLIRLFEEARFSTHSMTSWHRDRALDALHAVAADLAAPSRPSMSRRGG